MKSNFLNLPFRNHYLEISRLIPAVFTVTILLSGILTISFVNLPKVSAQTTTANQSSKTGPSPNPLEPTPQLSAAQKSASTNKTCSLTSTSVKLNGTPQQTEGPYFVDGMSNRSDIRSDSSTGVAQQGIPLHLIFHVYNVDNGSCIPVRGAKVDVWHANPQGIYSAINDLGTMGKDFLRGYQITDNNGTVKFTTIYPGWYQGRTIHIHDMVRTFNGSEKTMEWTSQLYFNDSINQETHTHPPYSDHGPPQTSNEEDIVYKGPSSDGLIQSNSGKELMLHMTKQGQSYLGTFNIVLNSSQSNR